MNSKLNNRIKTTLNDPVPNPHWQGSPMWQKIFWRTCSVTALVLFLLSVFTKPVIAQQVHVTVSYDTVYLGNVLGVQYSMEDWQGELVQPDFGEFEVVGGPQMNSSMSYSGGKRSSSKSILFYLKPPDQKGIYQLPSQRFQGEDEEASTEEIDIVVLGNSDGIEQNPAINKQPSRSFNKQYKRGAPQRGQRQRF